MKSKAEKVNDFTDFHLRNPHIYVELVRLARQWRAKYPTRRLGIQTLVELIRWSAEMESTSGDGFKINNDYAAYYARLIMHEEGDLKGIFETRVIR